MTPEQMATCHARAFAGRGRAWDAAEFARLLDGPHMIISGTTRSFALGRVAADEAELLTIATDPAHRRRGLARAALGDLHRAAASRGAVRIFLDVAADNLTALALYRAMSYRQVATRPAYYVTRSGARQHALVLERSLRD